MLAHQENSVVVQFSTFCIQKQPELQKLPGIGRLATTPIGQMFLTESAVQAFLEYLQAAKPVLSRTLMGKFTQLKKELRGLNLSVAVLPAWVEARHFPPLLHTYFNQLADKQASSRPPAKEKGYLTPEMIQAHCINLIVHWKLHPNEPIHIIDCYGALVCRLISGRSLRAINVFSLTFADVGWEGSSSDCDEGTPYIDCTVTKPLASMSPSKAVEAMPRSRILLVDNISKILFNTWMDYVPQEVKNGDHYFIPAKGSEGFLFDTKSDYDSLNGEVQIIAEALGIARDATHKASFTSKSIRQGVAADTDQLVKDCLSGRNKHLGRSPTSKQETSTYCPLRVLLAPGPLFDPDGPNAELESALHACTHEARARLLCMTCGYPSCPCIRCKEIGNGKTKKRSHEHSCWLEVYQGQPGKRSKNWTRETQEQLECRIAAWRALGLEDIPTFKDGHYQWED